MKKLLAVLAAVPALALAQGGPPPGTGPGGPGYGPPGTPAQRFEQMEKRMRIARAVGLSEALDLDEAGATKLAGTLSRFDDQRKPLMKQVHDSMQVLRRAASGDAPSLKQVDEATKAIFDARAKMQQIDRDMYSAVAKDLSPEKRARAAVFLAHFQGRFGAGMGPGGGMGPRNGMGPGQHGRGGWGMGPGGPPGSGGDMGPGPGGGPPGPPGGELLGFDDE